MKVLLKKPRIDRHGNIPGTNWYIYEWAVDMTSKELYAVSKWTRQAAKWLRLKERAKKAKSEAPLSVEPRDRKRTDVEGKC